MNSRDPSSSQLTRDDVLQLAEAHPEWWPDDAHGDATAVDKLGRGESFDAWLLHRGQQELVLRAPHKPLRELPQTLAGEHAVLQRVPAGLAARPIAVHEPTTEDPRAWILTSRVPGEVLAPASWDDDVLLAALARQLARLHVHGDRTGLPAPERIDPVRDVEAARDWWRQNEPEAAAAIEPLWPAVRRHQELARSAFEEADIALLHGDPAAANLLVQDGVPRFVDWEWAQVGDTARDLAFIGGRIGADPWYVTLTAEQVRAQAEIYLKARSELSGLGTAEMRLEPLLVRRAAHLLHEAYFVAAHMHRVAAAGGEDADRAERTHRSLLEQISHWIA